MNQSNDSAESEMTESKSITEDLTDSWKESVQMDAIRIPHHAHSWIAEAGSLPTRS